MLGSIGHFYFPVMRGVAGVRGVLRRGGWAFCMDRVTSLAGDVGFECADGLGRGRRTTAMLGLVRPFSFSVRPEPVAFAWVHAPAHRDKCCVVRVKRQTNHGWSRRIWRGCREFRERLWLFDEFAAFRERRAGHKDELLRFRDGGVEGSCGDDGGFSPRASTRG